MKKRIVSLLLSLLLVCAMPLSAMAAEWDLGNGDVTVSVDADGTQTVSQGATTESDAAPTITGGNGSQTITVSTAGDKAANLTIENVNAKTIEVGASNATITVSGDNNEVNNKTGAGIHVSSGDLTITGDGKLEANLGGDSAGIGSEGYEDMSGSISIKDEASVTTTGGTGAGIGSGIEGEMSGTIAIEDNAQVNANSRIGAGIGSGSGTMGGGGMSGTITIGGTANVTAKASSSSFRGNGAGIGSGRDGTMSGTIAISTGATVDASSIGAGGYGTMSGKIQYFDPDPEPTQSAPAEVPLYRVLNENGQSVGYTSAVKDGVLTITVKGDYAKLTGTVAALKTLESRGYKAITLVTDNATSTFTLADLIAQGDGDDIYCLTHKGEEVTLTLNDEPLEGVLKDELL